MVNIAIIGCGNIAHIIKEKSSSITIKAVYDIDYKAAKLFAEEAGCLMAASIEELAGCDADVIVEAASPRAVREAGRCALEHGKDILIMSVGGLADKETYGELLSIARRTGAKIRIPSGAIGGLDAIQAAKTGGVSSIILQTTKPPSSLGLDLDERTLVFEGSPEEAIKKYPKNINVAVTLAIISGGNPVTVRIVADPSYTRNVHEVKVVGEVGTLTFTFDNTPSENKATSLIAGYSAVSILESLSSPLQF